MQKKKNNNANLPNPKATTKKPQPEKQPQNTKRNSLLRLPRWWYCSRPLSLASISKSPKKYFSLLPWSAENCQGKDIKDIKPDHEDMILKRL